MIRLALPKFRILPSETPLERVVGFVHARRRGLLMIVIVTYAFMLLGATAAWNRVRNRVEDWLPPGFHETQRLVEFVNRFGSDEILLVSWQGCALDQPIVSAYAGRLASASSGRKRERFFRSVATGPAAMAALTSPPLELSPSLARSRLQRWLIGRDGKTTCVLAVVSDEGMRDREAAVEAVYQCADDTPGLSRADLRVAGPTAHGVAIDSVSKDSLFVLNIVSWIVCFLAALLCLRDVVVASAVFFTALFMEHAGMAFVYVTGGHMDSILLTMASLLFVVGISTGIHFTGYYNAALRSGCDDARSAVCQALRGSIWPTALSTFTTALASFSLVTSEIVPVRRFAIYTSITVLLMFFAIFTILPLLLCFHKPSGERLLAMRRLDSGDHWAVWRSRVDILSRMRGAVLAAAVLLFLLGGIGLSRLRTTANIFDFFDDSVRIVQDERWVEERMGPLLPLELVVRFPRGESSAMLEQLRFVAEVERTLRTRCGLESTWSATSLLPALSTSGAKKSLRDILREKVLARGLPDLQSLFRESHLLASDDAFHYWRVSMRVPADAVQLPEQIDQVLVEMGGGGSSGPVSMEIVGGAVLINQVQRQLLMDLQKSYACAFVMIFLVFMFQLRGWKAGLLAMIPNLLPTFVVFGLLGWLQIPIGIGAVLTASIALGVSVDDTLHLLTGYRRTLARMENRREAVVHAIGKCFAPMVQTSLVCGFGILVFSASVFRPSAHFGWFLFWLLAVAIVSDVIVMSAILLSPKMGRVFR